MEENRLLLRIGAVAGIAGLVLQLIMGQLHPHRADPNDSLAAYGEYATSENWTLIHIGQFLGVLLIAFALISLAHSLSRRQGSSAAFALIGGVAVIVLVAVFAVQMAVDGVALKGTIDAWIDASGGAAEASALQVVDGVRFIEKGLSGLFHLVNGIALMALGLAVEAGGKYTKWIGWIGVIAGVGTFSGGIATAQTGFSSQAGVSLLPSFLLATVFVVGISVSMWREAATDESGSESHD